MVAELLHVHHLLFTLILTVLSHHIQSPSSPGTNWEGHTRGNILPDLLFNKKSLNSVLFVLFVLALLLPCLTTLLLLLLSNPVLLISHLPLFLAIQKWKPKNNSSNSLQLQPLIWLSAKIPEEHQANFDTIGEPLVHRLYLFLSMAEYAYMQLLSCNHCLMMQHFPSGSWNLEGYNLLCWHGALNCLPHSRHVVTLKNNLTMLKNIISVLTAHYDLALNEEFGLPNPSVDEDKVAEEVLNTQDRHTNMVPPKSIQVQ